MSFQDFLRTIPLVKRHLTRTLRLNHQNSKFRAFLEIKGINPDTVLGSTSSHDFQKVSFNGDFTKIQSSEECQIHLQKAQHSITALETRLIVLQTDYDALLRKLDEV